jgi:GTP pyrophosphokinase
MNELAEYGIAAHWYYDEKGAEVIPGKKFVWVKQLIEIQQDIMKKMQDIELLKVDFFKNRIFVFTPRGDVIELPEDATPVDFAYAIHTDIGNTCAGARINQQLVSLDTSLKNGDVVDIIVDKNRKGPNPDWINFVKTAQARSKIKQFSKRRLDSLRNFLPR